MAADEATCLVSIVVPVYQSSAILPALVDRVEASMNASAMGDSFELILVNDGSADASWEIIKSLSASRSFVRGLSLSRNFGQHNAVMAGLNHAAGTYVVLMDDDLQHPPEEIPRLVEALTRGFDVCYTRYLNRRHAAWKRAGSAVNDRMARWLLAKPSHVYLSSFKALRRTVVDQVVRYRGSNAYVDGLILSATRSITSVDISHADRANGSGNYGLGRSISLWLKMATGFSIAPLRFASLFGFVSALISVLLGVGVVIEKTLHPEISVGWASLMVVVLLFGALQMLCLGIVGEYVGRIYLQVNNTPQYVVADSTNRRPS